jgi:hypothetical protein
MCRRADDDTGIGDNNDRYRDGPAGYLDNGYVDDRDRGSDRNDSGDRHNGGNNRCDRDPCGDVRGGERDRCRRLDICSGERDRCRRRDASSNRSDAGILVASARHPARRRGSGSGGHRGLRLPAALGTRLSIRAHAQQRP